MCGINGIITSNNDLKRKITRANELISHRGPDDEGYFVTGKNSERNYQYSGIDSIPEIKEKYPPFTISNGISEEVILAHRRLSIIDLTPNGHCPMSDIEGNIWITYNGEIYNYIELRTELQEAGYVFKTNSDTEVIINSYLMWGTGCLNRFNGMWAFAIWDKKKNLLFMARDRFGIKPLYYSYSGEFFAFSSEIKPLTIYHSNNSQVNKKKIPFYLIYGNRLNTEDTYLNDIKSLPSSSYLIYENGNFNTYQYYDIEKYDEPLLSDDETERKIVELLKDSVNLRFRSDVPVGTCLSGGFDSSSIVSLAAVSGKNNLNTFSAVWNQKNCDESFYIDIVNEKYNCSPHKVIPGEENFSKIFNDLCYYQEIPTEGPGLYPQWFVMKEAQNKVKVLLDGQGGDEVFGGYFLMGAYLRGLLRDRKIIRIIAEIPNYLKFLNKNGIHSFSNWLFPNQYGLLTMSKLSEKFNIVNRELLDSVEKNSLYFDVEPQRKFGNYLGNLSYHFIKNMTIPALLHYEDRSSMAHSIESRVPFLDYRLVELGVNMSSRHLSHKGISRPLYRKALKPFLPEEISGRKDKLGFPTPFALWSQGSLKNLIHDELFSSGNKLHNYININVLKQNINNHYSGIKDYSWEIWRILSLNNFLKLFSGSFS